MQLPTSRTVVATVQTRTEAGDGFKVEFQIPEFGHNTSYPIPVGRIPWEDADRLVPGTVVRIRLLRENVRAEGRNRDKEFGWWWGWGGYSDEPVTQTEATQVATTAVSRDTSIQRAVALKAAVELAGYNITTFQTPFGSLDVLAAAENFNRWLETGERIEE